MNRICLCWLHWKNFCWQNWMFFFHLFTLRSARISALVIVWKNRKVEYLSDFERGQIVDVRLAGASMTETAIVLLGVSRATVSVVMSAYTNHKKTTSAKRNSGRKSTLTERNRRTLRTFVSKYHTTTAVHVAGQQNWILILKALFPQELSDVSFTTPISTVGLQLPNLWLLKVMVRCVSYGVTTIKPGHRTTGNARVIWSDESSFTLFPTVGSVYVWRTPKEAYNPECLVAMVKHGGGSVTIWAAVSLYRILLVPLFPYMTELLQGSTWTG
jgi:hypothetical protein